MTKNFQRKYLTLGYRLPNFLSIPLFGDRQHFGLIVQQDDSCWKEWEQVMPVAYNETQKKSVGAFVNDAGYRVMSKVDLSDKKVLEIGPGDISHIGYWQGIPKCYVIADIRQDMLQISEHKLARKNISYISKLIKSRQIDYLPFEDSEFDVIVSFYSLEHLYPLSSHIEEFIRVLKPNGYLIGAIPCEGGTAWGTGRFLTSRRWFKKNTTINPDKIICWEHPNFADSILATLDRYMNQLHVSYWPLNFPVIDLNLVAKFIYSKK